MSGVECALLLISSSVRRQEVDEAEALSRTNSRSSLTRRSELLSRIITSQAKASFATLCSLQLCNISHLCLGPPRLSHLSHLLRFFHLISLIPARPLLLNQPTRACCFDAVAALTDAQTEPAVTRSSQRQLTTTVASTNHHEASVTLAHIISINTPRLLSIIHQSLMSSSA